MSHVFSRYAHAGLRVCICVRQIRHTCHVIDSPNVAVARAGAAILYACFWEVLGVSFSTPWRFASWPGVASLRNTLADVDYCKVVMNQKLVNDQALF